MFILRRIAGDSMTPALRPGQLVLAVRVGRSWRGLGRLLRVRPGQVVILRHDGLEKIKRVSRTRSGQVFVVGDNADASTDSRQFGWLSLDDVDAVVLWPMRNQ